MVSGSEGKSGGFWLKGDGGIKVWRVSDGQCMHTASHQTGDITAFHIRRHPGSVAGSRPGASAATYAAAGARVGAGTGSSADTTSIKASSLSSSWRSDEQEVSRVMSASKDGTVVEWEVEWREEDLRGGSHNLKWSAGFLNRGVRSSQVKSGQVN